MAEISNNVTYNETCMIMAAVFGDGSAYSSSYTYDFMSMFNSQKSNWASLNSTTARPLAMAMQGGQAPCR